MFLTTPTCPVSVSLLYVATLNLTWFTATDIMLLSYKPVTEGEKVV